MNKINQQNSESLFRTLLPYLKPVAWRNLLGVFLLILLSYVSIQVPEFVKRVINGLPGAGEDVINLQQLYQYCMIILGLSFLAAVLLFLARWLIIGASREIERQIRNDLFAHIQKLTPRFYTQHRTGDLVTRFASDIEAARLLVGPGIMYPGQTILFTILAFIAMFNISISLTLTLTIPVVVLLLYVNFNTRRLHKVYRRAQDIYSNLTSMVQENISGIRVIKAYCQEDAELERFRELNQKYVECNIEQIKLRGKLFPFMKFISGIGIVLILWRGGLLVMEQNDFALGELIQFVFYYQMLTWPIIALGWIINVIHRGVASWKRITGILATPPEVVLNDDQLKEDAILKGHIEIKHLTFAYTKNTEPVLKDVSFEIKPGQTLAIIGPTGCGKSTLVSLLLHLYPIPRGHIFFDGNDINDISFSSLRRSIGYVSQEVFLFSDTIRNNILFGIDSYDCNGEMVEMAAEQSQLARDLNALHDGYETEIGERGVTLSGGQKQRTGIARALILDRPIMILDDCLSAVDTSTEEAILQNLKGEMENRTTIVISHRISTVKNADIILVLDDGQIVEQGTHEELLSNEALYAKIHKRQLLEESLGIRP